MTLTYHKWNNHLKCHYCGYTQNLPAVCSNCKHKEFSDKGFGTEQIEQNLKELFQLILLREWIMILQGERRRMREDNFDFERGED